MFFLLWQKELRELAAGVYNLLKGRRQHVMPVGEFMDRVSNSDENVEANLSTVFRMYGALNSTGFYVAARYSAC